MFPRPEGTRMTLPGGVSVDKRMVATNVPKTDGIPATRMTHGLSSVFLNR